MVQSIEVLSIPLLNLGLPVGAFALLLAGLLYVVFIATVVYHVVVLGVAAGGHGCGTD